MRASEVSVCVGESRYDASPASRTTLHVTGGLHDGPVEIPVRARDTGNLMVGPGSRRRSLSATLTAAYGDGLLSDQTLSHRLEQLLGALVVDPDRLVGDLTARPRPRRLSARIRAAAAAAWAARPGAGERTDNPPLLALDWSGNTDSLTLGRDPACDVVLGKPTVSRRHAVLRFRDGAWIVQDLGSRNGTAVNRRRVVRCRLRPGDRLRVGEQTLVVD
jgi:hypothetical protein